VVINKAKTNEKKKNLLGWLAALNCTSFVLIAPFFIAYF